MMEATNFVQVELDAIIVGKFNILIINFEIFYYFFVFSETCNGSAENNCQTCNSLNHRTLVPTAHTCPCDMYYYDLGSVDCKECHYSW